MDNGKFTSITKKITVWGIVQGVGFRPFFFRLAEKYGLKGTVRNVGGLVEIIIQSTHQSIDAFLQDLNTHDYEILKIESENLQSKKYTDFKIIDSSVNDEISIIPPDLPVCAECEKELYEQNDRRYENPFISCMSCGPRYTIIEELPYDRHNTTMKDFAMCHSCQNEYTSPYERRFHAQTISCNDCGPYLIFNNLFNNDALEEAVKILTLGGIVAVKGIGGYHFACSPFLEDAVQNLRRLKGREEKPFAIMFPTIKSISEYCIVTDKEKELLQSKARPIVLLYRKNKGMTNS